MKLSEKEIFGGIAVFIILIGLVSALVIINSSGDSNRITGNFLAEREPICGDNFCDDTEMYSCYEDCDWCGDGTCSEEETCSSCVNDCGQCEVELKCGDGICSLNECETCASDCSLSECQNGICEPSKGENCVSAPGDCRCKNGYCNKNTKQCEYVSCGNDVCDEDEDYINCPNDCDKPIEKVIFDRTSNYPLIFIHGHSMDSQEFSGFSLSTWNKFQKKLEEDNLYYDKGIIYASDNINNFRKDEYVDLDKPVSFRMTYYKNIQDENKVEIGDQDSAPINTYARRLSEVVKIIKHVTGKEKVDIVAHSMGGLVAREYIKHVDGYKHVNKLVTVGTPNHGIWVEDNFFTTGWCGIKHPGPECSDMRHESDFIKNLNYPDETPFDVKYMAIVGKCSEVIALSDGLIRVESARLEGAEEVYLECSGIWDFTYWEGTFHTNLPNPDRVPAVYTSIVDFLKS